MKIHPRYNHLLFSVFMSMIVAFIVTGVLTAVNLGYENFISNWERSFGIAWSIAFISVLTIAPRVSRWVQRLTAQ